jgi:nitrogen fixation/metabolism regulation signal transduction histidine kinase
MIAAMAETEPIVRGAIVNELLVAGRYGWELTRRALDLGAMMAQLMPDEPEVLGLYATAQESGRLHAELEHGLPHIVGDGTQLRQVIHNLVQNALDAIAERADGRVRVCTEIARDDHGELRAVRLQVLDNGPGFPDKVLKRAFEPYVTTKSKGTGLGLAVVKKIADEHGARVRIANVGGTGGGEGHPAASAVQGAQVSLSFSKLAPGDGAIVVTATDAAGAT